MRKYKFKVGKITYISLTLFLLLSFVFSVSENHYGYLYIGLPLVLIFFLFYLFFDQVSFSDEKISKSFIYSMRWENIKKVKIVVNNQIFLFSNDFPFYCGIPIDNVNNGDELLTLILNKVSENNIELEDLRMKK